MEYFAELDQIRVQVEQLGAQYIQGNEMIRILMIVTGVIAVLWCFFGLKLVRFWAALFGAALGFILGIGAAAALNLSTTVSIAVGGVVGILLAGLAAWIYHVGIFLVVCGASLSILLTFVQPKQFIGAVLCGAAGLVIGLITVRFAEPVTMVITGVYGASVLAEVISYFASFEEVRIQTILTVVLAVCGIIVQFLLESGRRKRLHLKKAAEIRKKYSTENEVEKARAMMETLEQEAEDEENSDGKGHRYED